MTMLKQIEKEKQNLARCEKSLALEKIKIRKTDTRRKIEFGGLVIKSSMDVYNKAIILGGLAYLTQLITRDERHLKLFESIGSH
ncbi:TPA: conjugal transfer protein TraD, partial [Legionella pneumophila]